MKLTTERNTLHAALSKAVSIVERRNTIPILANVMISSQDGQFSITATDLDIEVNTTSSGTVDKPGATTVSGGLLADIVAKIPAKNMITMETKAGRLVITAGKSVFDLATMEVADYPVMASNEYDHEFTAPGADIKKLIDAPKFAMSTEETRYYLNGIYLHHAGGVTKAVATDGHMLALASYAGHTDEFQGVIIPSKTVMQLSKLIDISDVTVSISATKIKFDLGSTVIVSKVIDGVFPDYTRIIPKKNGNVMTVDAKELIDGINLVATVADDRVRGVKMSLGGDVVGLSVASQSGVAEDEVAVSYTGKPLEIGFNSKYLVSALGTGDHTMEFGGEGDPAIIRPVGSDFMAIVMPMRV